MDTTNTLAITAFILQFTLFSTWLFILNKRIERTESSKCRCSSTSHLLLDPTNL